MIRPNAFLVRLFSVLCTNCDKWADYGDTVSLYPSGQSEYFIFAATERVLLNSEVCHPRCVFKLYGEVNSVKNTTINIWLNDGVY